MFKITVKNADKVIKMLDEYAEGFEDKRKEFMKKLAYIGFDEATVRLEQAEFAGDKSSAIITSPQWVNDNKLVLSATGNNPTAPIMMFIEFGTGTYFPDDHPKAAEFNAVRGSYGKHKGLNPPWYYIGKPGDYSTVVRTKSTGEEVVRTVGNPANRVMFSASEEIRKQIVDIAKEVFQR